MGKNLQHKIATLKSVYLKQTEKKQSCAKYVSQNLAVHVYSSSAVGMLGCEEKALEPLLFAVYLDRFIDCNQWLYA